MGTEHIAKTEMTKFWQFIFSYCNEEYSCVLGWGLAGILAVLAVVLAAGFLINRAIKNRE